MDFSPTAEQDAAAALARQILSDQCTQQRLRHVELTDDRFDRDLWTKLGDAGLLDLSLPTEFGGAGLGILELCSVLVEVGRSVAPIPLAWHATAAMTIAEFGSEEQMHAWVPAAGSGGDVLTAALSEDRADAPERPTTRAERTAGGWRITGRKTVVPSGTIADLFVVPADTEAGCTVFLVRPDDAGVSVERQEVSDGDSTARLELSDVHIGDERVLGEVGQGAEITRWLTQRLVVGLCALQLGIAAGALELTSGYAGTREQFGRPIGTFQAVSQRLADGYIDLQGIRLTLWQAAWRLSEGLPAEIEVATAKLWAADAGHKIAHTAVHVHGGVGIDLDGEAHRYFTAAKRVEFTLGGATEQARIIGRVLAAEPA